jgi:MerR family transcriptional regulator, redox-sensitive transcriptional activator SoxR
MQELTIGAVARRAGVQTSAIRYYESVGLLPAPRRVNGRRCYDASIFQRLGVIQVARQAGFGIRELQTLFTGFSDGTPASMRWQTLITPKLAEMEALIERAQARKTLLMEAQQCRCVDIGDCVTVTFDQADRRMQVSLSCPK